MIEEIHIDGRIRFIMMLEGISAFIRQKCRCDDSLPTNQGHMSERMPPKPTIDNEVTSNTIIKSTYIVHKAFKMEIFFQSREPCIANVCAVYSQQGVSNCNVSNFSPIQKTQPV